MDVKIVAITQSLVEGINTPEELIVYIARVSNPSNQMNTETSVKLINYLIRNKHWSPFEQVDLTVDILTSRAIAQQILRHWSMRFQEFSQRYASVMAFEEINLRYQADKNRQSSEELLNERDILYFGPRVNRQIEEATKLYIEMLDAGVAKECARMILPLTTQTRIFMKGNIRSWITYLQQRLDKHTQLEHRQVAEKIKVIFNEYFPNISKALEL